MLDRCVQVGAVAALFALAPAAPVRAAESTESFVARYELATADGMIRSAETLSVRHERATSFVSVSNADGASLSLPTEFAADGEIIANSFDPSVTCYNMAMAALYANAPATSRQSAVYVRFGNDTITVPVSYTRSHDSSGDTFVGSGTQAMTLMKESDSSKLPVGMIVAARIGLSGGALSDVAFSEATVVGSPAKTLSRMTCTLSRAGTPEPQIRKAPNSLQG